MRMRRIMREWLYETIHFLTSFSCEFWLNSRAGSLLVSGFHPNSSPANPLPSPPNKALPIQTPNSNIRTFEIRTRKRERKSFTSASSGMQRVSQSLAVCSTSQIRVSNTLTQGSRVHARVRVLFVVYSETAGAAEARLAATCLAMVSSSRCPFCVMKRPLYRRSNTQ